MRRLLALATVAATTAATSGFAATEAELDALFVAMGTPDLIEIMRIEGLAQGQAMEADMLGGQGGDSHL